MRVLVTGSRDWPYPQVVHAELDRLMADHTQGRLIIVHGDCRAGADAYADQWAKANARYGVRVERHPAKWNEYGRAAGPIRNSYMVSLGAGLCLAFNYMGSKGTKDCINRASIAGIPIRALELDLVELKGK